MSIKKAYAELKLCVLRMVKYSLVMEKQLIHLRDFWFDIAHALMTVDFGRMVFMAESNRKYQIETRQTH